VERYLPARLAIRAVERSAALVTANSDAAVREARRRGVRPDRIRLVRNGHAPVGPLPLPDDGVVRLGYVAQLRAEKGHLRLFETLRRVSTTAPWQVDLAGDGVLRAQLTRAAASSGLSERVRFLGEIDDVRAFWARQHVGLLLSDTEGSPNALIEAALAGRPLVATATGGTPDVVGPAGGFLVGLDDPDAGARAIESLIDDGALRRRLGAEAHLQARGRFALDASVDGHVQAIHEVLQARRG
jgi:glycosyltransferase involved in cell wall biosynthesis